jgi:hypothetical protein
MRVADVAGAFGATDLTTPAEQPGVARICTWISMCVPGPSPDIHPTTAGYEVIATAYLAQTTR